MAGLKQIGTRLKSVTNTRQITRAMKLVSAAKMRRAQDAVVNSRAYAAGVKLLLNEVISTARQLEIAHPLMQVAPEVKRILLLVIGGNRGLCGGFNSGLNKAVEAFIKEKQKEIPDVAIDSILLGRKPAEHYRRMKRECSSSYETLSEDPNKWPVEEICKKLEEDFIAGKFDEVHLIFTEFKSAMTQRPKVTKILPFALESSEEVESNGLTLFEPSASEVFMAVIPRILRVRILQAGLDSKASEHASRMAAMDSATKNAGELIDNLRLTYNRLRQTGITMELLDIVGGAEALKG